jgi:hypothetical protein
MNKSSMCSTRAHGRSREAARTQCLSDSKHDAKVQSQMRTHMFTRYTLDFNMFTSRPPPGRPTVGACACAPHTTRECIIFFGASTTRINTIKREDECVVISHACGVNKNEPRSAAAAV